MLLQAFVVTGAPALIIILVILIVLVLGVIQMFRLGARGAKKVVDAGARESGRVGRRR